MATHINTPGVDNIDAVQPNRYLGEPHAFTADQRLLPLRGYQDISDEAENGPWGRKTVISFDGGGVRGYSSLLILQKLMERIMQFELEQFGNQVQSSGDYPWMDRTNNDNGRNVNNTTQTDNIELFLPCHYFDYFAGTSTGGLSAIMLGRLRMSIGEALSQYAEFGNAVFGKARWLHERSALWYPRAKYASRRARGAFQRIIHQKLSQQDPQGRYRAESEPLKSKDESTRTMVFSFCIDKREGLSYPYLWRSYDHQGPIPRQPTTMSWKVMTPSPGNLEPIWQVARATSAAPRYFESIRIKDRKFLDGGMCANNPSLSALREVRQKHGHRPALFLSLGTGKKNGNATPQAPLQLRDFARSERVDDSRRRQFLKKYLEIGKHWKAFMTDPEGESGTNGWIGFCDAIKLKERHRLNVEGDLAEIPLDDWRPSDSGESTLQKIRETTETYLNNEDIQATIDTIARELVRIRRRRAETERWEEFALDLTYRCPIPDCQDSPLADYKSRDRLRQHLVNSEKHRDLSEADREANLDLGRGNSR